MSRMIQISAATNNLLVTAYRQYTRSSPYPKGGYTNDMIIKAALLAYLKQGEGKP